MKHSIGKLLKLMFAIIRQMSQTHSLARPLITSRLALLTISSLFNDRFGRSLRDFYLEFDKEAISDGERSENGRYR